MGLSKDTICSSVYNSIDAAYISDQEKQALKKKVDDYLG